jgi:formamidopyrimidine-DNA glycosylase
MIHTTTRERSRALSQGGNGTVPELPDVEVFKNYLNATALHQTISGVEVREGSLLGEVSERDLRSHLKGSRLEKARRHGKYLLVEVAGGGFLVLHFGMTGFLRYFKNPEQSGEHTRMQIDFSGGYHLAYDCQRKLGLIDWVEDSEAFVARKELGDDPMHEQFDESRFRELMEGRRGSVKSALMNQSVIAGIGNIYSDEILFQAGIHSRSRVVHLKRHDLEALYDALREVLDTAIEAKADPSNMPTHYLTTVRGQEDTCPKCGGGLAAEKVSGRTSYYCTDHQPLKL